MLCGIQELDTKDSRVFKKKTYGSGSNRQVKYSEVGKHLDPLALLDGKARFQNGGGAVEL